MRKPEWKDHQQDYTRYCHNNGIAVGDPDSVRKWVKTVTDTNLEFMRVSDQLIDAKVIAWIEEEMHIRAERILLG